MSASRLLLRAAFHLALSLACLAAALLSVLRGLSTELADDIRSSRNEQPKRISGGNMKNRKVRDFDSTTLLRAVNAHLAAQHGDTQRTDALLAEASFYAGNAALPVRRSA